MARRRASAPVEPVEELDELEELSDDDTTEGDDLEELEDAPEPTPAKRTRGAKAAPAKAAPAKAAKAAPATRTAPAETSGFDSNWLAGYITEETGIEYDSRGIRMLLRKAAKEGILAREIGTDRQRYDFPKGANDPTVKAILRMVKSGEAAAVKREGLDAAKASAAAKKAAPAPAKAAPAKRTAKAAPAEAPAPASRRRRPANA